MGILLQFGIGSPVYPCCPWWWYIARQGIQHNCQKLHMLLSGGVTTVLNPTPASAPQRAAAAAAAARAAGTASPSGTAQPSSTAPTASTQPAASNTAGTCTARIMLAQSTNGVIQRGRSSLASPTCIAISCKAGATYACCLQHFAL